jgi:hypothetical protein
MATHLAMAEGVTEVQRLNKVRYVDTYSGLAPRTRGICQSVAWHTTPSDLESRPDLLSGFCLRANLQFQSFREPVLSAPALFARASPGLTHFCPVNYSLAPQQLRHCARGGHRVYARASPVLSVTASRNSNALPIQEPSFLVSCIAYAVLD